MGRLWLARRRRPCRPFDVVMPSGTCNQKFKLASFGKKSNAANPSGIARLHQPTDERDLQSECPSSGTE